MNLPSNLVKKIHVPAPIGPSRGGGKRPNINFGFWRGLRFPCFSCYLSADTSIRSARWHSTIFRLDALNRRFEFLDSTLLTSGKQSLQDCPYLLRSIPSLSAPQSSLFRRCSFTAQLGFNFKPLNHVPCAAPISLAGSLQRGAGTSLGDVEVAIRFAGH